jgi:hypothetical protein
MPQSKLQAPPDVFYNESEACKYITSSRIIKTQVSKRRWMCVWIRVTK